MVVPILMVGVLIVGLLAEVLFRWVEPNTVWVPDRPSFLVVTVAARSRIRDFRARDPKPPGAFRILVLGDSYTWGANVQLNQTYPEHLEWLLNASSSKTYEVINYGVNGASTRDEIRMLDEILPLEPDLVILGYFLNDPDPNRDLPPALARLFQERIRTPVWQQKLQKISHLYRYLRFKWWARRMVAAQVRYFRSLFDPNGPVWARHAQELNQMAAWSHEHDIPLIVVIWPHLGFPMDKRYPFRDIHERLYRFFIQQQVAAMDLYRVFRGMDSERLQTVPLFDPHPSEIAHRIAAEALFDWLRREHPYVKSHIRAWRLQKNNVIPSVRLRMAPIEGFRLFPGR